MNPLARRGAIASKRYVLPVAQVAFLPSDLGAKLTGWWKKDSATVNKWTDMSGVGNHFVQDTSGNQPSLDGTNGGLTFSGSTKFMDCAAIDAGLYTEGIAAAVSFVNNTSDQQVLSGTTGNARQLIGQSTGFVWVNAQGSTALSSKAYVSGKQLIGYVGAANRTNTKVQVNGVYDNPATNSSAPWTGSSIVTRLAGTGALSIHEMVRFNSSTVTTTERQKVEGYVAWNNGTQSVLDASHPYKNAAPTRDANYLTDENGNRLTDQSGNYLIY